MKGFIYSIVDAIGVVGDHWSGVFKRQNDAKKKEMMERIRFFKPTLIDGFWGKSTHWEMRDKPLTDEELNQFDK